MKAVGKPSNQFERMCKAPWVNTINVQPRTELFPICILITLHYICWSTPSHLYAGYNCLTLLPEHLCCNSQPLSIWWGLSKTKNINFMNICVNCQYSIVFWQEVLCGNVSYLCMSNIFVEITPAISMPANLLCFQPAHQFFHSECVIQSHLLSHLSFCSLWPFHRPFNI